MDRKKEKGVSHANRRMHRGATLREEITGITHADASCISKTQHLRRLAAWASREARLCPLAAFLGRKFASEAEALRIPLEPSAFLCESCETLFRPGINCAVRIEKFTIRRRRSSEIWRRSRRNKVVYQCHFCSHKNQTWGTVKGQVPSLLSSQQVQNPKLISCDSIDRLEDKCRKVIVISKVGSNPEGAASGNMTGTSSLRKRRRRGRMSLRKIVENEFKEKNIANFAIPFCL